MAIAPATPVAEPTPEQWTQGWWEQGRTQVSIGGALELFGPSVYEYVSLTDLTTIGESIHAGLVSGLGRRWPLLPPVPHTPALRAPEVLRFGVAVDAAEQSAALLSTTLSSAASLWSNAVGAALRRTIDTQQRALLSFWTGWRPPTLHVSTLEILSTMSRERISTPNRAVRAVADLQEWLDLSVEDVARLAGTSKSAILYWKRSGAAPRPGTARMLYRVHALIEALRRSRSGGDAQVLLNATAERYQASPLDLLFEGRYSDAELALRPYLFRRKGEVAGEHSAEVAEWPTATDVDTAPNMAPLRGPLRRRRRRRRDK